MSSDILQDLIGQHVTIYSVIGQHEARDEGVLESYDGHFVRLRTHDGDLMLFSIYRVRLIRQLYSARPR